MLKAVTHSQWGGKTRSMLRNMDASGYINKRHESFGEEVLNALGRYIRMIKDSTGPLLSKNE